MTEKSGFLIQNNGGGSLNWTRFEDVGFTSAKQAFDHAADMKSSGSWPGRSFKVYEVPGASLPGLLSEIKRSQGATLEPLHVGKPAIRPPEMTR